MEVLYLSKNLYLRGKATLLAVLNFNDSCRTHVVALKCDSVRELVISVILNSVGKPQPMCVPSALGGNEQHHARPLGTWWRNNILKYLNPVVS